MSPIAAAGWLADNEQFARKECARERLSSIVQAASRAALTAGETECLSVRLLGERYADLLSADAALAAVGCIAAGTAVDAVRVIAEAALKREPAHAGLLRAAAEHAVAAGEGEEGHSLLTRLARADGGQATVHRVHRMRAKLGPSGDLPVRVALLSSFTIEPLVAYADVELRALGLEPAFYVAQLNAWPREMVDTEAGLRLFAPEIAFLSVSIDDLAPTLVGDPSPEELDAAGASAIERVLSAARDFADWSQAPLVVHSFYSAHRAPGSIRESRSPQARTRWLNALNARLGDALRSLPRAYLLDMGELLLHREGGRVDNPKMRYLAGMRLTGSALQEVARSYAHYVAPLKGLTRKCVIVDLDNTLWGGTVGEDGLHGIKLGSTSPGIEFQDFQRYLMALNRSGILLAIASKNNADDALEVVRSHDGMILREADFSALRINWEPKTESLVSIADELGIGLDSLVFLDDNPNERECVRQLLPEVLVPELPADPALFRRSVEDLPQLQQLVVTAEDRERVDMYRSRGERVRARTLGRSVAEFLQSLFIEVEIAAAGETTLPRVHQLMQRTNQFNLTTRRYDERQLAQFARDRAWRVFVLRARDRFGDHGLVAVALVRVEATSWIVDSFLMSCRVIGLGVETALLSVVSEHARDAGVQSLVGELIETRKNLPARDFYVRHDFSVCGTEGELTRFCRELSSCIEPPSWVKMSVVHVP